MPRIPLPLHVAAATLAMAAPLTAALATAAPASAEPRCEIRYRWNGNGTISGTAWVDASTCGRQSRIQVQCSGLGYIYNVQGNTVTTGTTKATCNAALGEGVRAGAWMQYKVGTTWYTTSIPGKGSHTIYTY